ncbi:AraC family transcriptional regulator [Solidesulfovibrio sp.]|uniref:AraC family transcriptional regulator n=1 Tax=Solidesulfovibrio sp. TaxID=2910990 RepID=UPI002639C097|nr:AraC family transcriptional regulator [Solidesulfovibrio sp.]
MTPSTETSRERLAGLLAVQARRDGFSDSPLPGVRYARAVSHYPLAPALYEPSVVILATGRKRALVGGAVHSLDPGHYWVVAVPLAFSCETFATADAPLYGLSVRVDPAVLGELLLEMDDAPGDAFGAPSEPADAVGMRAMPMTAHIADAAARLAECLGAPDEARILGPGIVREIVFRVLRGGQGPTLRALAAQNGRLRAVSRALRRIHADFKDELDVESLAREAHMGLSTFHHAFRAVTATTPLQYVKAVRLHKARALLAEPGATAAEAAQRVGYASASQFSREYKRLFGAPPSEEIARLRGAAG